MHLLLDANLDILAKTFQYAALLHASSRLHKLSYVPHRGSIFLLRFFRSECFCILTLMLLPVFTLRPRKRRPALTKQNGTKRDKKENFPSSG